MSDKDWYDSIGTTHENSPNREAPNKHLKGAKKYREQIHRESKVLDQKNLPYSFGKPQKSSSGIRDIYATCSSGHIKPITKTIVSYVCRECQEYVKITSENSYSNLESLE